MSLFSSISAAGSIRWILVIGSVALRRFIHVCVRKVHLDGFKIVYIWFFKSGCDCLKIKLTSVFRWLLLLLVFCRFVFLFTGGRHERGSFGSEWFYDAWTTIVANIAIITIITIIAIVTIVLFLSQAQLVSFLLTIGGRGLWDMFSHLFMYHIWRLKCFFDALHCLNLLKVLAE